MKKLLLKTILLLFALVAGTAASWAASTQVLSFSRSKTTDTYTKGYTFSAQAEGNDGFYQDGSGSERSLTLYHESNKLFASTPGTITFTAKLGGGSAKNPLSKSVYVCFVDKEGSVIENSSVEVTTKITSTTGSNFSVKMPVDKSSNAYGVKIYHNKEKGYNVRYYSFSLSYEYELPAYTITAVSNNEAWGTVSGTSTITATPKEGYRVKAGDNGYTVTSGTATVVNNGDNTFSVNPSTNCTVQINFEEIPSHTLSSTVLPVAAAGTITLGSTSVSEGSTTTATAAANAGYKFTGWSISGTDASLSSPTDNPTEVTMGTADATVTATFKAVVTHKISWSVNGVIVKTDNVEDGAAIDFAAPASGIPTGYTFMGWVADRIDGTTDTDPANYVKAANATAEVTYYAVMAVGTESPVTAQLTADEIASNFASTAMAYDNDEKTYTDTDDGVTWGTRCITYKDKHFMQLKKGANVYIKASAAGAITEVSVTISNASNKSGGIDNISMHGNFAGTVYLDNVQTTNTGKYGSGSNKDIVSNVLTIVPSAASNTLYIHVDAGARIWNVVIRYNDASYTGYCTTVPPVSVTVTSANYATYVSDFDLDFTGKGIKAYIAKADGTTGVSFTQVEKVPANTGVLLYKDGGTTEKIPVLTGAAEDVTDNVFKRGTGAAVASEDGTLRNYILNQRDGVAGFYKANNQMVATNRAYIQIDESTPVKGFIALPGSDEETGIETMRDGENEKMSAIFDLSGRRVAKPTRGLYIVNGKKVLVK